jgi:hypothetical protein
MARKRWITVAKIKAECAKLGIPAPPACADMSDDDQLTQEAFDRYVTPAPTPTCAKLSESAKLSLQGLIEGHITHMEINLDTIRENLIHNMRWLSRELAREADALENDRDLRPSRNGYISRTSLSTDIDCDAAALCDLMRQREVLHVLAEEAKTQKPTSERT